MSIARIQIGDKVKVITGKNKGLTGSVTKVVKKQKKNGQTQLRVAVSELPQVTKYRKSYKAANMPGMMYQVDRLIDASNVALVTSKGDVSKVKTEEKDGKKARVLKKTGEVVKKAETAKKKEEDKKDEKKKSKKKETKK